MKKFVIDEEFYPSIYGLLCAAQQYFRKAAEDFMTEEGSFLDKNRMESPALSVIGYDIQETRSNPDYDEIISLPDWSIVYPDNPIMGFVRFFQNERRKISGCWSLGYLQLSELVAVGIVNERKGMVSFRIRDLHKLEGDLVKMGNSRIMKSKYE